MFEEINKEQWLRMKENAVEEYELPEAELERIISHWAERRKEDLAEYSVDDLMGGIRLLLKAVLDTTETEENWRLTMPPYRLAP